jgi:hypothetical protein
MLDNFLKKCFISRRANYEDNNLNADATRMLKRSHHQAKNSDTQVLGLHSLQIYLLLLKMQRIWEALFSMIQ